MEHRTFDLTIIIPAYCEERRIGATLDELREFLVSDTFWRHKRVEVIVVAADAPDKTHAIVRSKATLFSEHSIAFQLLNPGPKVGKGRDVQYGVLRASGDRVLYMDADLATPLHHVEPFYSICSSGTDIVIGTRDLLNYRVSKLRNLFSYLGNGLYRLAGGVQVEDTQCGFKMFNRQAAHLCFSRLTLLGWGFDVELLTIAKLNGLTIRSCGIDDWKDCPYSTYNDAPVQIAVRSIYDFVYIEVNKLRGAYRRKTM